jgi:putative transposase
MSRPLRIEFPGAIYHVTSRGDRRELIYRDDADRVAQLAVIEHAMDRFDAQVLAYCLMGNHFHLVLHTRQANLSRLMRHVNGVYTQGYNRRHSLVGHVFQGRFKAILVDRDAYLLALCRYVERNPVAASLVRAPGDWAWSSYRAHIGLDSTPGWLDTDGLHGYLLGRPVSGSADRRRACAQYAALAVRADAEDATFWHDGVRGQVFLGDEDFVQRMQAMVPATARVTKEIPKEQRRLPVRSWAAYLADLDGDRDRALHAAYRAGGMTMTALSRESGLSVAHVGRRIAAVEEGIKRGLSR